MDEYKISQNPEDAKKAAKKKAAKLPKKANSRLLSPQLVLGGTVIAVVLVFAGVFAATHFNIHIPGTPIGGAKKGGAKPTTPGAVPGDAFNAVTNGIANKNPGALNRYYAKNVHVVIPGRSVNQNVSGNKVESLIGDILNGAQNPWNWHPSPSQIADWQQGPYGQYFEGDVIVGISDDGIVVVITFDDNGQIITIFIAPVGDLTSPTPPADGTGGGGGTDTTPPPDQSPPVDSNDSD